jgi:hypothetical protein
MIGRLYLGLLVRSTVITFELILGTQGLRVRILPQTVSYRGILVDVDLEVEKVLVLAAHSLTV